jgi:deferrochelatase/peroxidase EfeB
MAQALVTIAAPIVTDRIAQALSLIEALGNPSAPSLAAALDRLDGDDGVHFASLHAIPPTDANSATGHLVLEFSADGTEDAALARVVDRVGAELEPVFALAADRGGGDLAPYLAAHKLKLGVGWTGRTGLAFAGTPGMSVGRIRREAALAARLTPLLERQPGGLSALARVGMIRDDIRGDPDFAWALETPSALAVAPKFTTLSLVLGVAGAFAATYLWPLLVPYLVVLGYGADRDWGPLMALLAGGTAAPLKTWMVLKALWSALLWALAAACAFAIPALLLAVWLYLDLRAKEASDWLDERAPLRPVLHAILARENVGSQNHMVSVTTRKPGLTRRLTTRLAFWLIGQLAVRQFKPGHLGDIGTIHFARWVMLPGGRDFVFFSNYGGSWESYLEDFITKAHNGLTAVWSNTVGFPRAENLFAKGATDGERFKRFARRSMLPTPFWHSAYPTLTTDNIRSNAAIRCGLAAAMTDEEAKTWLALFGSAQRPAAKLESDQIQSLVFGGLGFKPFGEALLVDLSDDRGAARAWLLVDLSDDRGAARAWLGALRPRVAFDDGRRLQDDAVLTLALGPGALAKAGLPSDALESFPPAFLDGMTGPGRARILGDDQADGAWWWGAERGPDAAVLVYAETAGAAGALAAEVRAQTLAHGHVVAAVIALNEVVKEPHEPFGFLDGVSQPVIRGTYRGLRNPDPIHLVEPGEFILGYPDNRGNLPPGPTLKALDDPGNLLPIRCDGGFATPIVDAPREVGRNGSFLVIRQLEQDHEAFWTYCEAEAARLKDRLPAPYDITPAFIGAKLVGRWPNGSSLVRNPYQPFGVKPLESKATQRPLSHPTAPPSVAPALRIVAPAPIAPAAAVAPRDRGDNDFLFGAEDPQGLRCPYGAHIRRANPRDSLDPGSQDQVDISNRHRVIRVGRSYAPQDGQKPGLLFMCLNGDLERQFEFVQQTWLGSQTFHGLVGERDPLAGNTAGCPNGFTIPTRDGPVRLAPLARFVTPRGGGYFFLPGKTLLAFLSD